MSKKRVSLFLVLMLLLTAIMPMGYTKSVVSEEKNYIGGEVIVQFEQSLKKEDKEKYKNEIGATSSNQLNDTGLELVKFSKNKSVEEVIAKLETKKGVKYAEVNNILRLSVIPTNDPYNSDLWGLDDANIYGVDAPDVWDQTMGEGIVVAVLDTGVDKRHIDLKYQLLPGASFINGIMDVENYSDDHGHGTHVSGTIAAVADNRKGIVGVAPNVKVLPIKCFGSDGTGTDADAILAIEYAKAQGADIINASWGSYTYNASLKDAIANFGGPFIAAAGNNGLDLEKIVKGETLEDDDGNVYNDLHYPSSYELDNVISVASIDALGALSKFSNHGITTVDIAAPGEYIWSTIPGNQYTYSSGTSMATPHVAGVVALLMSENLDYGKLDSSEIVSFVLENSTIDMGLSLITGSRINAEVLIDNYTGYGVEPPVVDVTAPTIGNASIEVSNVTSSSVDLSWEKATDNGVDSDLLYQVYYQTGVDETSYGDLVKDIGALTVTGLMAETSYTFTVTVEDAAGNVSAYDVSAPITTEAESEPEPEPTTGIYVIGTTPSDGKRNAKTATDITFTFNDLAGATLVANTVVVNGEEVTIESITGNTVVVTTATLDSKSTYTVEIPSGLFSNGDVLSEALTFTFTTGK